MLSWKKRQKETDGQGTSESASCCPADTCHPIAYHHFGGKGNKNDIAIIRGESGTKSLVVYFSQADVVDLDKTDAVSSASMRTDNSRNVYGNTEYVARLFQQATGADLYSIQTSRLYYESYPLTAYRAFWEELFNTRPKLIGLPDDLDQYDTIYI